MTRRSLPRRFLDWLVLTIAMVSAALVAPAWLNTLIFLGSEADNPTNTGLEDVAFRPPVSTSSG